MEGTRTTLTPQVRLIHWYDTRTHRLACGAPGQMDSTKYARGVTCASCLGVVLKVGRAEQAAGVSRLE